ncbi:MAG: DMT family transporter [Hylemonella sp.]
MSQPILPAPSRLQSIALATAFPLIVVWGVNFSLQKFVFNVFSPPGFLFARYLVMPACAVALLLYHYGLRLPRVPRRDLWVLAKLGFAGHFLHVGIVTYGIHWSTPFSSSLILACGPVFTLLILRQLGIERLRRAQVLGVAVALVGVLIFLSDKLIRARWQASLGDLSLLLAASLFSYYTVASKPLIERHGGVVTMTYAILLGSPPIVLTTLPVAWSLDWASISAQAWAGFLWVVVVSAFIGWLVWGWINSIRGVARTAPLMYLMPPVAGVTAWFTTGEQFTAIKLLGAALAMIGVAIAQFSPSGARVPPNPID